MIKKEDNLKYMGHVQNTKEIIIDDEDIDKILERNPNFTPAQVKTTLLELVKAKLSETHSFEITNELVVVEKTVDDYFKNREKI